MVDKKKNIPNSYHCFKNDEQIGAIFKAPIFLCVMNYVKNLEQDIPMPKKPKEITIRQISLSSKSLIYCIMINGVI